MDPSIDKQGGFQETQSNYARKLIDLLDYWSLTYVIFSDFNIPIPLGTLGETRSKEAWFSLG